MTSAILVLAIVVVAVVLFFTEWLRMDLVALLVLGTLAITGLVTTEQALSGFSNPAVVTVWAMFILSAGLLNTGVAEVIGRTALGWVGAGEARTIVVVMLTAGVLSAFMNNIGVAALMLPVVIELARQSGHPPSRLLMPLAYGTLLGGLTTLIGTPPNILASEAVRDQGLADFHMFDFTPVGGAVMLGGIAFVALFGRRLLPRRDPARETSGGDLRQQYALDERSAVVRLPENSSLDGRTLRESRLGSATGLNVYAVLRHGNIRLAPHAAFNLKSGDRLLVEGTLERLAELRAWRDLTIERREPSLDDLLSREVGLAKLLVAEDSGLEGLTLVRAEFRRRFGVVVLAVRRGSDVRQMNLADLPLRGGDCLLVQGLRERLGELVTTDEFSECTEFTNRDVIDEYGLSGRLFAVRVPQGSVLAGKSLAESRVGDALRLGVLGLVRGNETTMMPEPDRVLEGDDLLLVRGRREDLQVFRGLQGLEIESEARHDLATLELGDTAPMEVMLSPRTSLAGKTLRELDFRERYGLQALAVLREGRVHRSGLRDLPLRFGDALLLLGPQDKRLLLSRDADFLVLTPEERPALRRERRLIASLIMAGVILPVILGWLPIAISAVIGVSLMVLTGCLSFDDAYRAIEWRAVFLIAGMLPLGVAMQQSGAAELVADGVVKLTSPAGPWGVLIGLYLMTALATSIIPTAALVVLMAPIAFDAATATGVSPRSMMMAVAIAASASFTSPVSHPANILVMGPGGYRFVDYVKLGAPLTLVVLVIVLIVLPFVWPLY
jgi:di/tricarboxylate transporter